jgi:hypothetical protein
MCNGQKTPRARRAKIEETKKKEEAAHRQQVKE